MNTEQERAEFRALVESLASDQQERADFEAWHAGKYWAPLFDDELGRFVPAVVQNRWKAYQAGRAALQSQDREDVERINFIEANPGWLRVSRLGHRTKQMWACVSPFTDYEHDLFKTAREAIDHARRIEGEL